MSACTVWDVLSFMSKYDGSNTALEDVVKNFNQAAIEYNHSKVTKDMAWCTETLVSAIYKAGGLDLIGFARDSKTLLKNAKAKGIWKAGSADILPGDIVLYGSNGVPNHSEIAIGDNLNISGNYNNQCKRRVRSRGTLLGRIRPKYKEMGNMSALQLTIAASDVILGVYGSGDTRIKQLRVFGQNNSKKIQDKVNQILKKEDDILFSLAVYTIAGRAGKNDYRKIRLGKYFTKAQNKIDYIYNLKGQSTEKIANLVLNGAFGNDDVRTLLLTFCNYNSKTIQNKVNDLLKKQQKKEKEISNRIRIWQIWISQSNSDLYGDSYAIIEYKQDNKTINHCILIDTGPTKGDTLKKLKKLNPPQIDAIFLSHGHGDHVDGLEQICKTFKVKKVFISDYSKMINVSAATGAVNKLKKAATIAKKYDAEAIYMKKGFTYQIGNIKCEFVYQADPASLKEKDDHHFVNMMSTALMFNLNGWKFFTAGDISYEAINNMVNKIAKNILNCDIFKIDWHGDRNGIKIALAKIASPLIALSNYHHSKSRGGRSLTYKVFTDVGAIVAAAYQNGQIYVDCLKSEMKLSCSKNNLNKAFKK